MMKNRLVIYASPIPATYIAGPAIAKLISKNLDCQVQLKTNDQQAFFNTSQNASFDLGIFDISAYKDSPQFDCEFLLRSTAKFCCRRDHPLLAESKIKAHDIRNFPIALPSAMQDYAVFELNRILGLPIANGQCEVNLRYDSLVTIRHALIHSNIIAIAPSLALNQSLSNELVEIDVVDWPLMEAEFGIITKKSQSLTSLANEMIDYLFETSGALAS